MLSSRITNIDDYIAPVGGNHLVMIGDTPVLIDKAGKPLTTYRSPAVWSTPNAVIELENNFPDVMAYHNRFVFDEPQETTIYLFGTMRMNEKMWVKAISRDSDTLYLANEEVVKLFNETAGEQPQEEIIHSEIEKFVRHEKASLVERKGDHALYIAGDGDNRQGYIFEVKSAELWFKHPEIVDWEIYSQGLVVIMPRGMLLLRRRDLETKMLRGGFVNHNGLITTVMGEVLYPDKLFAWRKK